MSSIPAHLQEQTRSDSPVAQLTGSGNATISTPLTPASTPVRIPPQTNVTAGGTAVGAGGAGAGKDFLAKFGGAPPAPPGAQTGGQQQNVGAGGGRDGAPPATDTVNLGQLKAVAAALRPKQTLYTFPSPPPDSSDMRSELEEFYSYVEVSQVLEHKDSFLNSWDHRTSFNSTPRPIQIEHIEQLLLDLASPGADVRFTAARHLVYIVQGCFATSTSPEHQLHLILSNVAILRTAGALVPVWAAVKSAATRWEAASVIPPEDNGRATPDMSAAQREKQAALDEVNGELALLLTILYFMVEATRGDETWADELMTLDPPMPIFLFNMVAGLRERNAKGYPVKKLLLLLWKSILACIGGMKDVARIKLFVREVEGLPPDDLNRKTGPRPETKVAPPDFQSFRNEITSKYPSYVATGLTEPYPPVDLDRISAASAPTPVRATFSYHINPNHEPSNLPAPPPNQQPVTPAPTPPQSPAPTGPPPKPKKQQFQTDQSKPFVLPFGPANAGPKGRPRNVPQSIDEAAELYRRNMRVSTELWQTWKLREEFMADERGILRAEMEERKASVSGKERMGESGEEEEEDDPLSLLQKLGKRLAEQEEKEEDTREKKKLATKRADVKRLERVEILYRAVLPQMQSAVIVLLKLLLATVTANTNMNQGGNGADSGNEEVVELGLEDTDILRHREITSKAVSAILILSLKWFKVSHVMKFNYLAQLLVDSNCLLLILKMFGLQEVSTSVKTKNDRADHNYFKFCNDAINPPSPGSLPRAEDALLENRPPGARPANQTGDDDEVELITDYSWRNFFAIINFVHILQKLTKRKTHRVLLLVQYKSSAILKRILKVSHPSLQLYVLKVIKSQVPYCGRKWRQSNMKVITAIYLHCRPDLRDEWLTGIDVDSDVEESLPQEQALRALVRFFNTRHYGAFAPQIHRRSSSSNPPGPEFGQVPPSPGGGDRRPPSENDVFPPTRSMASFDPEREPPQRSVPAYSPDLGEDFGDYEVEDLLGPRYDSDGELDLDPLTSQAAWDRLGEFMGTWDDISDSESVGSFNFLGFGRDDASDGSVSDLDIDEIDEAQNRVEWEAMSPETISALEEERKATTSSPLSPRPRSRRSSQGPISPALRPVLIDLDDDSTGEQVEDGPAATEPHAGPAVDEVELVFGQ
ncbi:hypothetical protein MNV49_004845 [Pseudohyphozyma bogoriensis]|nr:hypothetical protein MNV49_004845 [Pseudohyphozyma bogoriensis]